MNADNIIKFWFEELEPKNWYTQSDNLDNLINERFLSLYNAAAACELYKWRESPKGRLAEIIVLDQLSRNLFRGTAKAFAADSMALTLSQEAILHGSYQELDTKMRTFMYMPFMHSESPLIHKTAVKLFSIEGMESALDFEMQHKKIVDRFARYPHRNKILNRESTAEEIDFLKMPNSSF